VARAMTTKQFVERVNDLLEAFINGHITYNEYTEMIGDLESRR
jgi:hypothetical protein